MTVERTFPAGAWRISDIISGFYIWRVYYEYTRHEAITLFRREMY